MFRSCSPKLLQSFRCINKDFCIRNGFFYHSHCISLLPNPQATKAKISACFGSWLCRIPVSKSLKQVNRVNRLPQHISISHQISLSTWHSHSTCIVFSALPSHISHVSLQRIFRLNKFFFVGSNLQQARHKKCFILLGMSRLHSFFQNPLFAIGFDWPGFVNASLSASNR